MEVIFHVQATKEHLHRFRDLNEQRNTIDRALKALNEEVRLYPKIALAREIAGSSGSFSVEIQNSGSVAVVAHITEVTPPVAPPKMKTRPTFYNLDGSTINLLLNSKLLTDDQKKKMLAAVNDGFEQILGIEKEAE